MDICEIKIFPVPKNELIPFGKELVISEIHNCLKEKEGLLEVSTGKTNS